VDVTKAPPPATTLPRPPGVPARDSNSQSASAVAPAPDRANIRPLDIPAALQILLAEVRVAFGLTALGMGSDANILIDSPPQAARAVLEVFLSNDAQAEALLQAGLDRGIGAISAWREVPPMVVDAAKETRALILSLLADDSQNPAWLRLEWASLAPRLERFRRRRRLARRQLSDPDYPERSLDDNDEHRS
jgi:hypothetical protein